MRVRVKAADGLRVPVGGRQYVTDEPVEMERTAFVAWLIGTGDLVEIADRKTPAKDAAAAPAPVKEG